MQQGQTVTLKVRNPLYESRDKFANKYVGPEFEEYTGTVVNVPHFNGDVGLTTDDPYFPIRRISRAAIVEVNSARVDLSETISLPSKKTVTGSKGQTYVVTTVDGKSYCTCQGFKFRKTCRHVIKA